MKTAARVVLLALLAGLAANAESQAKPAPPSAEVVSVLKTPGLLPRLRRMGFDLLADWEGKIYIVADPRDLSSLRSEGLAFAPEKGRLPTPQRGIPVVQGGPNGAYHSYKELETELLDLQKRFPALAQVQSLGDSLERRRVYALKIGSSLAPSGSAPGVLLLGCHHAREWISVEVPLLLGKYLLESYSSDPVVKSLVDSSEIWIVPLVNPDGLEYTIQVYRYWRKNRRDNGDGTFGVDVNRNYAFAWGFDNVGSSPDPGSDIFRGKAAFSEPETRAVRDLFLRKTFRSVISYHSFAQDIIFPWGYTTQPTDKDAALAAIAARMADLIRGVNGRAYTFGESSRELYLTNGELTDWTYGLKGIPSYTIELPPADEIHGGFVNAEADIDSIFRENLPAMLYLLDWSVRNPGPAPETDPGDRRSSSPRSSGKIPGQGRLAKNPGRMN